MMAYVKKSGSALYAAVWLVVVGVSTLGGIGVAVAETTSSSKAFTLDKVKELTQINALLPKIGMTVVDVEDDQHVLASANKRYVVKGTLTDMWNGVSESTVINQAYTALPAALDENVFFLRFGTVDKPVIRVYVSALCEQCYPLLSSLFTPQAQAQFDIHIGLVHNSVEGRAIANKVYCAGERKHAAFEALVVKRDYSQLDQYSNCDDTTANLMNHVAMAQDVFALPMTFFVARNQAVVGRIDAFL